LFFVDVKTGLNDIAWLFFILVPQFVWSLWTVMFFNASATLLGRRADLFTHLCVPLSTAEACHFPVTTYLVGACAVLDLRV
jgi:hypothetical protein